MSAHASSGHIPRRPFHSRSRACPIVSSIRSVRRRCSNRSHGSSSALGRARILIASIDHVGRSMAGPGIRAYRFAKELARDNDVTLAVPFATDLAVAADGIELVQIRPDDDTGLTALVNGFDIVVAQQLPVLTMHHLAKTRIRTVYDLYAPVTVEQLALDSHRDRSHRNDLWFRRNSLVQEVVLRTGDAFICASERQRDLWLGALAALGRIDQDRYAGDPALRNLIDVVPFGIEPEPPVPGAPAVKGVIPGIGENDRLLLWSGGIWDWFDPLTVIRAVHELAQRRDDVRLYFLGLKHPNPEIGEMTMAARAVRLSEELGLRDRIVFFNFGWVPYEERGRYLLEADVAVSAHFDDLETRFAFRTRMLDCFWAGLPVVTTTGDVLGDLVDRRGLGRVVPPRDVAAWATALETLLDSSDAQERTRRAIAEVRDEYLWPRVVEPLRRLVREPGAPIPRRRTVAPGAGWVQWRLRHAVVDRGVRGAAVRALQIARRRLPR